MDNHSSNSNVSLDCMKESSFSLVGSKSRNLDRSESRASSNSLFYNDIIIIHQRGEVNWRGDERAVIWYVIIFIAILMYLLPSIYLSIQSTLHLYIYLDILPISIE